MARDLAEKATIHLAGLLLAVGSHGVEETAIALLLAVILASLFEYLERPPHQLGLIALSLGSYLLWPPSLCFFPAFGYDCVARRKPWALALFAPLAILAYPRLGLLALARLGALAALAALLALRARAAASALQAAYRERDGGAEAILRLETERRLREERQGFELHLATLEERNRIARDLHDGVGHVLTSALLQTAALQAGSADPAEREALGRLRATLDRGMSDVRASVHRLHDASLDLPARIRELCDDFVFCELDCSVKLDSSPPREQALAILAAVKEAMANVARHSDARRFGIRLREHPAFYQLVLEDDGTTAKASVRRPGSPGLGLEGMRQRFERLGGRMSVTTTEGFRIFISVPKEAAP